MMIPVLITGATSEERLKKAEKITNCELRVTNYELRITSCEFIFLDSPNTIGIDEIRDLQKKLSLKPYGPGPKIAIINNAQNLTTEAQNAFLKTLEESPKNSQIILSAPTSEVLLPTVVSRCQIINLPYQLQSSLTKKEICQYLNILISLISSSTGERLQKIEALDLFKDRQKAIEWADIQTVVIRQALLGLIAPSRPPKPSSPPCLPAGRSLPSLFQLFLILQSLLKTKKYLQANVNLRLALDNFVLDLPKLK